MFCHYMNKEDAKSGVTRCLKKWEGVTTATVQSGNADEDADTFGWMDSPENEPGEKYTLKDYLHNGQYCASGLAYHAAEGMARCTNTKQFKFGNNSPFEEDMEENPI